MYKKLSNFENAMCHVLKIINSGRYNEINELPDFDTAIAIHQCIADKYIEQLEEWRDANGNYHFPRVGIPHLTQAGFKFLRDMSKFHRFKKAAFEILKGTTGFILGIASTVIAEIIILLITHPEEISKFLP